MDRAEFLERHRSLYADRCIPEPHIAILVALADDLRLPGAAPISAPSSSALDLIRSFEKYEGELPDGRVQSVQRGKSDGGGWKIGWGCTGPDIVAGTIWTSEEAEERFRAQVQEVANGVMNLLGAAPTTQNQFDALTSFAFQNGVPALGSSLLLQRHRAGDYMSAATEFLKWNKIGTRVRRWLVSRRTREANRYQGKLDGEG